MRDFSMFACLTAPECAYETDQRCLLDSVDAYKRGFHVLGSLRRMETNPSRFLVLLSTRVAKYLADGNRRRQDKKMIRIYGVTIS